MGDSSARLLERARAGDAAALDELLEEYQARIYRFGLKMCRNTQDAEDVLQDTLIAMARGVREFRGASSVSTWLYGIARSYCIKKRRKSKFAPAFEERIDASQGLLANELRDLGQPPDDVLANRQIESALSQAIRALEPKYREVLLLRDVEGLTAPEVAEVLQVSQQAVKSRLHRARLAVRAYMAPLLDLPNVRLAPPGCPDVVGLFSRHLEGDIDASTCLEMERHLEQCPHCRATCDSLKKTLALCHASSSESDVPPDVQAAVRRAIRAMDSQLNG
jgi:RNA polymerase sigma-70 factor, ECF subfamily